MANRSLSFGSELFEVVICVGYSTNGSLYIWWVQIIVFPDCAQNLSGTFLKRWLICLRFKNTYIIFFNYRVNIFWKSWYKRTQHRIALSNTKTWCCLPSAPVNKSSHNYDLLNIAVTAFIETWFFMFVNSSRQHPGADSSGSGAHAGHKREKKLLILTFKRSHFVAELLRGQRFGFKTQT